MSLNIKRDEFEKIPSNSEEELNLEKLSNGGWISTTEFFKRYFGDYQPNNTDHKKIFIKLKNNLKKISKKLSLEILTDQKNLIYDGDYYRKEACEELADQIEKLKCNSKSDLMKNILSADEL